VGRERLIEPIDQLMVEAVTEGKTRREGDEDYDETGAELAEMIDKPRSLVRTKTPR